MVEWVQGGSVIYGRAGPHLARAHKGIDLVDEDDGGLQMGGDRKQHAHQLLPLTDPLAGEG
jgi:hypothetical protein